MSGSRDELESVGGDSASSSEDVERTSSGSTEQDSEESFARSQLADAISKAAAGSSRSTTDDQSTESKQNQDSMSELGLDSATRGDFGIERRGSTSTASDSAPESGTTTSEPPEPSEPSGGSSDPAPAPEPEPTRDPGVQEQGTGRTAEPEPAPSTDPDPQTEPSSGSGDTSRSQSPRDRSAGTDATAGAGAVAEAAANRGGTADQSQTEGFDPSEDLSGGRSFQEAENRDDRVGEAARDFEEELVERDPNLDEEDVAINVVEENGERRLEPVFSREFRREEARRDVRQRVINTTEAGPEDIEDVRITDDGAEIQFSDEYRREQALETATERSNFNRSAFEAEVRDSGEVAITLSERGARDVRAMTDNTAGPQRQQIGRDARAGPAPENEQSDVAVLSNFAGDDDNPFEEAQRLDDPGRQIVDEDEDREEFLATLDDTSELEATIGEDLDRDGDRAFRYESVGPLQVQAFSEGELVDPSERRRENARRRVRNRAEDQLPEDFEAGEDFRVVERDGRFTARLTEEGGERLAELRRERAEERAEQQIATRFDLADDQVNVDATTRSESELLRSRQRARESETVDRVRTLDLELSRFTRENILEAQVADANEDLRRSDVQAFKDGETGELGVKVVGNQEEFGDARIPIPGSGTTLEGVARGYSRLFTENVSEPLSSAVGDSASRVQRGLAFSSPATATSAPEQGEETNFTRTSEAIARDTAELANVPRTVVALDEASETIGYGIEETSAGRGDEFARDLGQATGEAVDAGVTEFQENPARTTARVGASLVITGGAIGAASRASSTAGRATAFAIQPGEEIASATATRLFPRTASRLPGGRIDVEEGTLAAGRAASRRVRRRVDRVRQQIRGEQSLAGSPRQQELVDRFRPGSQRGNFERENAGEVTRETDAVAGARSEPLGSPTEDIIDATVGTGRPRPESSDSAGRTEVDTAREEPAGSDELPLRDEIQEAGGARPFARGEDLPPRVPDDALEPNIRDLMQGDRAQVQLGRTRSEIETETEPEVRPGDVQSELQSRTLRQRRELSQEVESRRDPLRSRAESRSISRERARRPEVRTTETEIGRTDVDLEPLTDEAQASSVRQELRSRGRTDALELQEQAQRPEARTEAGPVGRTEVAPIPEVAVDARQEVAARPAIRSRTRVLPRTEARTDARTRAETRTALRTEFDFGRDPRSEFESPFDSGRETSLERFDVGRRTGSSEYDPADEVVVGGSAEDEDSTLGTGWLSETVATIATQGRRTAEAPSQEVLEEQPLGPRLTGELPTALEISGDEQTQEAIEDVEDLLSFGTGGSNR